MITYFKDKNRKSKKRYENYKTLNTFLESVDTIVIMRATSVLIFLSVFGFGLIVSPKSAGRACFLSLGNKILHKLIVNKSNKYKKQFGNNQETIKPFDKFYKKSLQDNLINKNEYESFVDILLNLCLIQKVNHFINLNMKEKLKFFSRNKLKLNLEYRI